MGRKEQIISVNQARINAKAIRLEKVAEYMVKQLKPVEIQAALANEGIINPDTNEPFGISTIRGDISDLRNDAIERANATVDQHRARQLEEIAFIKRNALNETNKIKGGRLALDAIRLEADLLGTKAPIKVDIQLIGMIVKRFEVLGIDPNEAFKKFYERLE